MSTQEKINYDAHLKNMAISQSKLETAMLKGEHNTKGFMAGKLLPKDFRMKKLLILPG
jgi:hypothetical protein